MKTRDILAALWDRGLLSWPVIIAAVVILLTSTGCASCPTPDPVIVKVPVTVPTDPLPLADMPAWKTPGVDSSDAPAYIRALVHDLLAAWAVIVEDQHTITAYNESLSDGQP